MTFKKPLFLITLLGLLLGFYVSYFELGGHRLTQLARAFLPAVVTAPATSPVSSSPELTQVATPEPDSRFGLPQKLVITKLGIEAVVEHVGLDDQQRMAVPQHDQNVGWYKYGAIPGEIGNSVLAGHFDTPGGTPAVFYRLDELVPGDEIMVIDDTNLTQTFIVTRTELLPDHSFPIEQVFGGSHGKQLNLITCAGQFDQTTQNYQDRLVVYTSLRE